MPLATALPGTPQWLAVRNDRMVLELLFAHGILSRNQISELSGLSKPTASQIVTRLKSADLVHVTGKAVGGRGPNAVLHAVNNDLVKGVAVDMGPEFIRSTVVDAIGSEYPVAEIPAPSRRVSRDAVAEVKAAIEAACDLAQIGRNAVSAVCLGVQGSVNARSDTLHFANTFEGWPAQGARSLIEAELGCRVYIENDVNLAAIAERSEGAVRGTESFVLFWLGQGLGVAVYAGGEIQRGAAGGAGEIGYLPVPRIAAFDNPGAIDMQSLLGGLAVASIARENGLSGETYFDLLRTAGSSGNEAARELIVGDLIPQITHGVIPILALLDPERIVLGGPTAHLGGDLLAQGVRDRISVTTRWGTPDIVATSVQGHPVLRGAYYFLLAELREQLCKRVRVSAG
ncbi:ROK family transcriptional regulator [Lysinibacter sp. HNR]|uniref:ROK family transcriptional regulator n=1 Tax=Lysinibacter sp. HNR TaxID=3031408 RepID=UPI002434F2D9|nr:ROK family transcriptional regulator [Lysinibacter sp. HNR]WGD37198.1 ROK family transcriptional regulator [Lysinibacter sp. HNR]